jgi:hypothetical protein
MKLGIKRYVASTNLDQDAFPQFIGKPVLTTYTLFYLNNIIHFIDYSIPGQPYFIVYTRPKSE